MRTAFAGLALTYLTAALGCAAPTTTFVLEPSQRRAGYDTYQLKFMPHVEDGELDEGLRESFVEGFGAGLEAAGGLRPLAGAPTARTLVLHYRAAGLTEGSLAARAGTAAVNALLPVAVVPEIGGGHLGMETTFFDADGRISGKVLVQAIVRGLLSTDGLAMSKIGAATAEYTSARFAIRAASDESAPPPTIEGTRVVSLLSDDAKRALSIFEPLVGDWDLDFRIDIPGRESQSGKMLKTARLVADGCIYTDLTESLGEPKTFAMSMIVWDPIERSLKLVGAESTFGAHDSDTLTCERDGNTLRAVLAEPEHVVEVVEVVSDDGNSRRGTTKVWNAEKKRLLLTSTTQGTRRRG